MKIYAKKRILVLAIACFVGFQPTVKAKDNSGYYYTVGMLGIAALWYFVPRLYSFINQSGSNLLKKLYKSKNIIANKKKAIEANAHPKLKEAIGKWNETFNSFKSEKNGEWALNCYQQLVHLNNSSIEEINKSNEKKEGGFIAFLKRECVVADLSKVSGLLGDNYVSSHATINDVFLRNKIGDMRMNEGELAIYLSAIKSRKFDSLNELDQFIDYVDLSLQSYRHNRAKILIGTCCALTVCEDGTQSAIKSKLLNRSSLDIVQIFSAAAMGRGKLNSIRDNNTEISKQAMLALCHQK